MEQGSYYRWVSQIAPKVGLAGCLIGSVTVERTIPQIVNTSVGVLSKASAADRLSMFRSTCVKQVAIKTAQFGCMREMKLGLERLTGSPALSTMIAYGSAGVPFQSVIYNLIIQDTYRYYGKTPGTSYSICSMAFVNGVVLPGLVWCFIRECCATGGGLYLGSVISEKVNRKIKEENKQVPEKVVRFGCGLGAGATCALLTQWLHNFTLTAGKLAALGTKEQAPHYTLVAARRAMQDYGWSVFYLNYPQRMMVIAIASATLTVANIFEHPELSILGCR